nr:hypothetical protein Iba_chr02eCG6530 [Ipomoea batatas]
MNTSTSPRVRLLGFHHRFTLDTPDREPPASGVKETDREEKEGEISESKVKTTQRTGRHILKSIDKDFLVVSQHVNNYLLDGFGQPHADPNHTIRVVKVEKRLPLVRLPAFGAQPFFPQPGGRCEVEPSASIESSVNPANASLDRAKSIHGHDVKLRLHLLTRVIRGYHYCITNQPPQRASKQRLPPWVHGYEYLNLSKGQVTWLPPPGSHLNTPDREPPASGVKETDREEKEGEILRVKGEDNSENWEK